MEIVREMRRRSEIRHIHSQTLGCLGQEFPVHDIPLPEIKRSAHLTENVKLSPEKSNGRKARVESRNP